MTLHIVGKVESWQPHPPEALRQMKDHLARLKALGIDAID